MIPPTTRRRFLAAIAAATAAASPEAIAAAPHDAELLALADQHATLDDMPYVSEDETDARGDQMTRIERQMAEIPAASQRGLLAKLRVMNRTYGPFDDEWLGASAIEDAERLLGGEARS